MRCVLEKREEVEIPKEEASGPAARLFASHTLTLLSTELAMRLPSGEYATEET